VTLSETRAELRRRRASHGWSLDGVEMVELLHDGPRLDSDNHLTMYHPSEVEMTDTTAKVLDAVKRVNPARVVFDSLSELRLLAQNSLRYRRQILALKQFFSGRHCTVLMLDDRTAEGPDMQLHSIAHGVISLDHRAPAYGRIAAAAAGGQVARQRLSQRPARLRDPPGGLVVFPRLKPPETRSPSRARCHRAAWRARRSSWAAASTAAPARCVSGRPAPASRPSRCSTRARPHSAASTRRCSPSTSRARRCWTAWPGWACGSRKAAGPGQLLIRRINPAEVSPGEFAHLVRQSVDRDGARVVIIDSLNGYLNAMPEGKFLTGAVARAARLPGQPRRGDLHRGGAKRHDGPEHGGAGGHDLPGRHRRADALLRARGPGEEGDLGAQAPHRRARVVDPPDLVRARRHAPERASR
jgi:circadian clock protein KaiC